jgi:RNA polymerase sigma-70 factor (ECF subfamily)
MRPLSLLGPRGLDALPDDDLMVRCGRGETAALEVLLGRHEAAAYRYCWRVFRHHHTAEDITQDFFLKLFRSASRYQPRGHFTTWFYRVLANLCYDTLRRRKRRRKVDGVHRDPIGAEGTDLEPVAATPDPDSGLGAEEARDAVHQALGALPIQVRKALELREFEGLRYREIGAVMDLSLNEVKVLLHRGRKLLARQLARTPVGRDWSQDEEPGGRPPLAGGSR